MLAWITGANGLIGSHLVRLAPRFAPDWSVAGLTRDQCDLTDFAAVDRAWNRQRPQLVIHCAAVTQSDVCQQAPDLARRANVDITRHLAHLADDVPFIFFSTDLVFDGRQGHYVEDDSPNPLSVYAETKWAAERIVLTNPRHAVVRTSLTSGLSPCGNRSFTEAMRRAWQAGRTIRLFTDEFRCPIGAPVTARAVWALVNQQASGLYHLAGSERLSRWEIGQRLAARCPGLLPRIEPASLRDYTGAPRPPDTSLRCDKLQRLLPFPLPGWTQWLAEQPNEAL